MLQTQYFQVRGSLVDNISSSPRFRVDRKPHALPCSMCPGRDNTVQPLSCLCMAQQGWSKVVNIHIDQASGSILVKPVLYWSIGQYWSIQIADNLKSIIKVLADRH